MSGIYNDADRKEAKKKEEQKNLKRLEIYKDLLNLLNKNVGHQGITHTQRLYLSLEPA